MTDSVRTIRTLPLEDYIPDGGQVRSDILQNLGTITRSNFSVDFELVYEVHGNYNRNDKDNASLLVIKVIPKPDNLKRQFVWLKITLTLLPEGGIQQGEEDEGTVPLLRSLEPASSGEQFADVFTTNETRERGLKGSIQAQVWGVSPGIEGSSSSTSEYKKHHLLRVKSGTCRTIRSMSRKTVNGAWWEVHAANKNDGIGDSFTVALLVARPQGSKFRLEANIDGEIGVLSETVKTFIPSGLRSKKDPVLLDIFGTSNSILDQKAPPGIFPDHLHAASIEGTMKEIAEVGIVATRSDLEDLKRVHNDDKAEATTDAPAANRKASDNYPTKVSPSLNQHLHSTVSPSGLPVGEYILNPDITQPAPNHEGGGLPAQNQLPRTNPSQMMARVGRLREIAALYNRLADLHREEAEDWLLACEWDYAGGN
ncbi:hypothetical protein CFAM422_006811 [Trichoderma lentiforme]|uniref:Uncharacterized protein n=1 Tax=Trichoderma lentiforme TaxID=1567552 RepID=A0A9P4XF57_9HYPO|nr:hypothetical protein CFAM422_006811 [Trichoderma lentiforme]